MEAGAPGSDLRVFERQPAECDHQARMLDDGGPIRDLADYWLKRADHARQYVLCRAEAVVGDLVDAAATEEEKSPQQGAGMMDAPRGRPAVGAAEDRRVAELRAHALNLLGHCRECFLPGHFAIAVVTGALLALAPALTYGGPRDAQRRMHHRRNSLQ